MPCSGRSAQELYGTQSQKKLYTTKKMQMEEAQIVMFTHNFKDVNYEMCDFSNLTLDGCEGSLLYFTFFHRR